MKNNKIADWFLRFVKGMFIGSGFILPGVSGGAMAAVFGIYERMINFIANITKNFAKNFAYFLPVGIGGVFGIFLLSFPVEFLLDKYEMQTMWFFIGCIVGTLPALWKEAGKQGRERKHVGIMIVAAIVGLAVLLGMKFLSPSLEAGNVSSREFPIWAWLLAGGMIGLGVIVPGLSPSNFLLFFGMYGAMSKGISSLDFKVIIPLGLGVVLCVLAFSKLMEWVLKKAYAGLFHIIFGIVLASTVMIVPTKYSYLSINTLVCLVVCALGFALGWWMSKLEEKYVPDLDK